MKNYAVTLLILWATPASAADGKAVFDCLGEVGASTTWEQCLGAMFEPCEDLSVGGDAHLACLSGEREEWLDRLQTDQADVMEILAPKGAAELEGLLSAWPTYVQSKCSSVADSRASAGHPRRSGGGPGPVRGAVVPNMGTEHPVVAEGTGEGAAP